ncbi:hypothetical protein EDF52_10288 [Curtobacterium sp. PhB42]|uniref:hypothetical protein n=1 Tax=Curtobacterium sp. PhB190 TaxID=2485201 RepID=UPI00106245FC|nr:hypothetical protein [Curtobacterium sp. PhB190]TDW51000.1 hypothetical protein EDF52_10288 [Curtobacterium sp. PhB42]TDW56154.1 hypothetical protein EDF47_104265 [Curtobacterium sp. PhB190]
MALLDDVTCALTVGSVALDIVDRQFTLSLDEGNRPFYQATATINRPSDSAYAALDPTRRSVVTAKISTGGVQYLSSGFLVHTRTADPSTNTVTLQLVSVEFDLLTYSPRTDTVWRNLTSVRTLCQEALSLTAGVVSTSVAFVGGATDKSFLTYTAAKNLFPNPNVTTNTGFTAYSSAGSSTTYVSAQLVQSTGTQAPYGNAARTTAKATLTSIDVRYPQNAPNPISGSAGQQYSASVSVRASAGLTNGTLYIQFCDSAGAVLQTYSKSTTEMTSNFVSSVRMSVTAVAPEGTSTIGLVLRATGSVVNGSVLDGAQWMVLEGNGLDPNAPSGTLHPFFSGATADSADYHYSWDGDADVSPSNRTPLVDRSPDSLVWTPGASADDFLEPILDAVGLRLFYREDGQWCLADNGYSLPGQLTVQDGSNLYEGTETVSIGEDSVDGYPMNADAVLLNYVWTDSITGQEKKAFDFAITPNYKRPYREEIERPFPGPGQAKHLLARLQARKYALDVIARPDFSARPGMTALISLPGSAAQTGYVEALDFDLSSAQMSVTTKGLVTALNNSYGKAPADQTYADVASTVTYATYTN